MLIHFLSEIMISLIVDESKFLSGIEAAFYVVKYLPISSLRLIISS